MDQGHKADEFVDRSQLQACLDFLRRLMEVMARDAGRIPQVSVG